MDRTRFITYTSTSERRVVVDEVSWAKFGDAEQSAGVRAVRPRSSDLEGGRARPGCRGCTDEGRRGSASCELRTQEQINAQLRRTLAESHPFWSRWKLFVDEAGGR